MGDAAAAKTFANPCTLCSKKEWTIHFQ